MQYRFGREMNFVGSGYPKGRKALVLIGVALAAMLAMAPSALPAKPALLTFTVAKVGAPGTPSVGLIPFEDKLFKICSEAPPPSEPRAPKCMAVARCGYSYG